MQDTEEIWKDVVGYEDLYQVSNRGNIIKLREWRRRSRKLSYCHGYAQTSLSKGTKTRKVVRVHRLVAEAFIPNPENKPHVNHINHIRKDNRIENLEWCTVSENLQHASKCGRLIRDMENIKQMNSEDIQRILHLKYNHNFSLSRIARIFGISVPTASRIFKENKWVPSQCMDYLKKAIRESID